MNQRGIREIHETVGELGHESSNLRQFLVRNGGRPDCTGT